jgi:hypothetical protein
VLTRPRRDTSIDEQAVQIARSCVVVADSNRRTNYCAQQICAQRDLQV